MKDTIRKILASLGILLGLLLFLTAIIAKSGIIKSVIELINQTEKDTNSYSRMSVNALLNIVLLYFAWLLFKAAYEEFRKKKKIESESLDTELIDNLEE